MEKKKKKRREETKRWRDRSDKSPAVIFSHGRRSETPRSLIQFACSRNAAITSRDSMHWFGLHVPRDPGDPKSCRPLSPSCSNFENDVGDWALWGSCLARPNTYGQLPVWPARSPVLRFSTIFQLPPSSRFFSRSLREICYDFTRHSCYFRNFVKFFYSSCHYFTDFALLQFFAFSNLLFKFTSPSIKCTPLQVQFFHKFVSLCHRNKNRIRAKAKLFYTEIEISTHLNRK